MISKTKIESQFASNSNIRQSIKRDLDRMFFNLDKYRPCESQDKYEDILMEEITKEHSQIELEESEQLQNSLRILTQQWSVKETIRRLYQKAMDN